MNEFELRAAIKELAEMEVTLTKKGGPSKAGRLFEKLLDKQQEILEHFKLPQTPFYQGLLGFKSIPWDNEIDELINLLEKESIQKAKNSKTDVEILREAKETNRDYMFILPQLGITTHVYTGFVYNNILMKEEDTVENILEELKFVNNSDLLNTLGIMDCTSDWLKDAESTITDMENKGLKYVRKFAMLHINFTKKMGFNINGF